MVDSHDTLGLFRGKPFEEAAVQEFAANLRGELIRPEDEDYDATRAVFNGMIDRHPALIARCAGVADVIQGVNFARTHNLALSVRSGGHSVAGNAVCDGRCGYG
jgi:FAD/FMN-containing dehydrogenase